MKSLYLRIWLTVVAALLLFALVAGLLVRSHVESERASLEASLAERMGAWGDLIQHSLPGPETDPQQQTAALNDWAERLRMPLALDDVDGNRIARSDSFTVREGHPAGRNMLSVRLRDGRTLWLMRPFGSRLARAVDPDAPAAVLGPRPLLRPPEADRAGDLVPGFPPPPPVNTAATDWLTEQIATIPGGFVLAALLAMLFVAVAAGAYPVVRRLTRRLEVLERGVVAFGQGALHQRVQIDGNDEVATLAASFNGAAERIEALVRSHQSLLANASHELRSPLARMKMAVSMLDDASPERRSALAREIHTNIRELDALVEEVLLASRLEAGVAFDPQDGVDLLAVAAEECARVGASAEGRSVRVRGDERLLRRALRNLLENAQRYGGGGDVGVTLAAPDATRVELRVWDRGPGVPEAERERIFEPFYRLPGHAEVSGGVGLGLSLVRQIAQRHGGSVRCEPRDGGGSVFALTLPAPFRPSATAPVGAA